MNNKILRLYCRPGCEMCKGSKFLGGNPYVDCPDCTDGYTDSIIEFEDIGAKIYYQSKDKIYYIEKPIILEKPFIIRTWLSGEDIQVTRRGDISGQYTMRVCLSLVLRKGCVMIVNNRSIKLFYRE